MAVMHESDVRRTPCNRTPPSGQNPAIETPLLQAQKIPFYLVLKGSKKFFGAFGAEKHPLTLYFRVLLRFYALLVQLHAFLAQN